jgi:hypothetical protein
VEASRSSEFANINKIQAFLHERKRYHCFEKFRDMKTSLLLLSTLMENLLQKSLHAYKKFSIPFTNLFSYNFSGNYQRCFLALIDIKRIFLSCFDNNVKASTVAGKIF